MRRHEAVERQLVAGPGSLEHVGDHTM